MSVDYCDPVVPQRPSTPVAPIAERELESLLVADPSAFTCRFYTVIGIIWLKNTCKQIHNKQEKHQFTTVFKKVFVEKTNKHTVCANITTSLHPHTFLGRLTLHRGTTNSTRSVGLQDTPPIWTDKTLRLFGLN